MVIILVNPLQASEEPNRDEADSESEPNGNKSETRFLNKYAADSHSNLSRDWGVQTGPVWALERNCKDLLSPLYAPGLRLRKRGELLKHLMKSAILLSLLSCSF
jgi:hypothetical protein